MLGTCDPDLQTDFLDGDEKITFVSSEDKILIDDNGVTWKWLITVMEIQGVFYCKIDYWNFTENKSGCLENMFSSLDKVVRFIEESLPWAPLYHGVKILTFDGDYSYEDMGKIVTYWIQ